MLEFIQMDALKRTALFSLHQRLGARMTAFAGFEMPLSYGGILEEHRAVRAAAGIFDLCHMGEFELRGPRAIEVLERAMTNSAAALSEGRAQYTLMCAEDGGTIDDLIVYRVGAERYLLCVNASNIAADREWLAGLGAARADFRDLSDETGLVAVQGPRAIGILEPLARFPIARVRRFGVAEGEIAGVRCVAARTGYTGEDGFELFTPAARAPELFSAILEAGRACGLVPCGFGARDTLRLEAGMPLYGHELDRNTTPLEAGLGNFVRLGRPFIGESALGAARERGLRKHLIGLETDDARSVARQGYRLVRAEREAGVVTSGTLGPTVGRPIAMGYLFGGESTPPASGALEVEIRKRRVRATIVAMPFYRRAAA